MKIPFERVPSRRFLLLFESEKCLQNSYCLNIPCSRNNFFAPTHPHLFSVWYSHWAAALARLGHPKHSGFWRPAPNDALFSESRRLGTRFETSRAFVTTCLSHTAAKTSATPPSIQQHGFMVFLKFVFHTQCVNNFFLSTQNGANQTTSYSHIY